MTRAFLRRVGRALIGVLLLAQVVVSAYACPAWAPVSTMHATMPSSPAVGHATDPQSADCAGMGAAMDAGYANLCAAHCEHGQQSDRVAALTVPAALLAALYVTPLAPAPAVAPRPAADTASALVAASAPLAILHCCFRI